jgi:hypothetical protein
VVPSLDTPLVDGVDRVWCASLDAAWAQLRQLLPGRIDADEAARPLVDALEASAFSPSDLDPATVLALAGRHDDAWVRDAEARLREQFGSTADLQLFPSVPGPDVFVAYACMIGSWTFAEPFERLHGWTSFRRVRVDSFSLGSPFAEDKRYERLAEQALVHHHAFLHEDDEDDEDAEWVGEEFIVELVTDDPQVRLVLARPVRPPTLADAVQWTMTRMRDDVHYDPRARLRRDEKFQVPCVDFDLVRRYPQLHGTTVRDAEGETRAFGAMAERIRFRLDEGGAQLVSEGEFRGLCLAPRSVVFDSPFLVLVMRRGAPRPFFAAWIETPTFLVHDPTSAL